LTIDWPDAGKLWAGANVEDRDVRVEIVCCTDDKRK
jgi:hypothetical protein